MHLQKASDVGSPQRLGASSGPLSSGARVRPLRAMVVEDTDDTRELYASELEQAGFIVARAHNGEAALGSVAEFEPDIVVLDLMLPRINGFAVAGALRAGEKRPGKLKILAVTGLTSEAMRRVALEAGCDAVLWKPAEASVVIDEAQRLLESRDRSETGDP